MKKCFAVLALLASLTLVGCNEQITPDPSDENTQVSTPIENADDHKKDIEGEIDGEVVGNEKVYAITKGGEYELSGNMNGYVHVNAEGEEVTIRLNGASITSQMQSPIYIENAKEVTIAVSADSYNELIDERTSEEGATVYATCDLTIKGHGALVVNGTHNGIHTKDDLTIKNTILKVTAKNNALKGNDSVTIQSGDVIVISTGGDGIKTENNDVSEKGKQKGDVNISGGKIAIYSACDGIDCANEVKISETTQLEIFTNENSEYTGEVSKTSSELYLMTKNYVRTYRYAVLFTDTNGNTEWVDATLYGYTRTGEYYYQLKKDKKASTMQVFCFNGSQNNSTENYVAKSEKMTISSLDVYQMTQNATSISGDWGTFAYGKDDYSCKGIKGETITVTGGLLTINAKDDSIHGTNVQITDGNITVSTKDDGIHADEKLVIGGGTINVKTAYEGLEANLVEINGGNVTVYATDDGVNASSGTNTPCVTVTGGVLDVTVGTGDTDGIDSNGNYKQSGGFVISRCAVSGGMGGGLDLDGTCYVTGGTIVATGSMPNVNTTLNGMRVGQTSGGFGGGFGRPNMGGMTSQTSIRAGEYTLSDTNISFTLDRDYAGLWMISDLLKTSKSYTLTGTTTLSWTQTNGVMSVSV